MTTIVTRAGKGSALTHNEVDANFTNLNADKAELTAANTFSGANTFTSSTGQVFRQGTAQDGVLLRGRAGGTSNYVAEVVPTTLTASRVLTLPDVTGTVVTTGDTGTVTGTMIAPNTIVDADISTSAAIAHSKLASLTAGNVLIGNASNVPTSTALSGDVTVTSAGVTAIAAGAIVNADVNASAAIAYSKLSLANSIVDADINASAAIADTKLATIATAGKVSGTAITSGNIASAGGIRHTGSVGVGYATGAGGTVTQATSRTTGVTLSKLSGSITLFSTTTTAGQSSVFTVTNTLVEISDCIVVSHRSGGTAGAYIISVAAVAAGSFQLAVYTPAAQGTAAAPVINFAVIKAVTA